MISDGKLGFGLPAAACRSPVFVACDAFSWLGLGVRSEQDIQKMLAANVHIGSRNLDFQMEKYIFKRRADGESLGGLDACGSACVRSFKASLCRWMNYGRCIP